MIIVHVHVHVKPEHVEAFKKESVLNAGASVKEPGVVRFDVIQEEQLPERFLLIEIYRTSQDPARHKETDHYKRWRDAVAEMMASPRQAVAYRGIFPDVGGFEYHP